jgi:hypothetical protein
LAIIGNLRQQKEQFAMTTAKTKIKLWPPIHELTYTNGKRRWQVACMVNGKRIREVFETKALAEDKAAEIRNQVTNEGTAAFNLPARVRVEAVKAHLQWETVHTMSQWKEPEWTHVYNLLARTGERAVKGLNRPLRYVTAREAQRARIVTTACCRPRVACRNGNGEACQAAWT